MSNAPKLPAGAVEGGWTDYFSHGVRRGQPRSFASVEPRPIAQPVFAAWKKLVNGSTMWAVVETKDGKFVRTVQETDYLVGRRQIPLTEARANELAAQMNGGST